MIRDVIEHRVNGIADIVGFIQRVRIEKRFCSHAHRNLCHFPTRIDDLAVFPRIQTTRNDFVHRHRVAAYGLRMKERRNKLPLAPPRITIGREKTPTRHRKKHDFERQALEQMLRLFNEHFVNKLGAEHHDRGEMKQLECAYGADFFLCANQKISGPTSKFGGMTIPRPDKSGRSAMVFMGSAGAFMDKLLSR